MNKHASWIILFLGMMIFGLCHPFTSQAQAPQSISYQAIVRDAGGEPIADQPVSLQITLHQGNISGTVVYCETHSVTTNPLGLVNIAIGTGTVVTGSFPDIGWETGLYFLELEMDPSGGTTYVSMGTTQLISVPYALFSDNVARIQDRPVSSAPPNVNQVLQWDGSQWGPATLSGGSTGWSLTGNAGTDPAANFVGTTDNQPLKFRVNNLPAGEINPITDNTFLGERAGENSTGTNNTALGSEALKWNSTGYNNTAIGRVALYVNDTGYRNTAIGCSSMHQNIGGHYNTATGFNTLYFNTLGSRNTANGTYALQNNTIGQQNTAVGFNAMLSNKANSRNTAVGYQAMYYANDSETGINTDNTAVGWEALRGISPASENTGKYNTAVGMGALQKNKTGNANAAVGHAALGQNTEGDYNTAVGSIALNNNTTGARNTAIGREAMYHNKANSRSTAIGFHAMYYAHNSETEINTYNTAVGYEALLGSTTPANNTGIRNTALGYAAITSNTTGTSNTAVGTSALMANDTGSFNTATGNSAMRYNTGGSYNSATGHAALYDNTTGGYNAAYGAVALTHNTEGTQNVATGYAALHDNTTGSDNTATGYVALTNNTTGHSNVAVGARALYSNTDRSNLVAVGDSALFNNGTGATGSPQAKYNTAIGSKALYSNTTGNGNTATGSQSLYANITGNWNTAIGVNALISNTEGSMNTANGLGALYSNTEGDSNTGIGVSALLDNSTGSCNTANGNFALTNNTTGNSNTALGYNAGCSNSTGSGNVFIGYQAGYNETGSNKLYLANSSTTPPLIYGDFSTGSVSLGTITPHSSAKLEVSSTSQGFLPPRMTQSQRTAISSPAAGLLVYQTDAPSGYYYYTGSGWVGIESAGAGSSSSCIDYDGNAYPTFTIGNQVWMAENLRVTHYKNGDAIPNVTGNSEWDDKTTGAYCWYDNSYAANAKYGTLYNWYAVSDSRGLCPEGWHEPSQAEWTVLETYLGYPAGVKMKSVSVLWAPGEPGSEHINNSGFSGLPGGLRSTNGVFEELGYYAYFWTSTSYLPLYGTAYCRYLQYGDNLLHENYPYKDSGFSVRCLKD